VSTVAATGGPFTLTRDATVSTDVPGIGDYLAGILRVSTGFALPVSAGAGGTIALVLSGAPATVGDQGYQLTSTHDGVVIRAAKPAGLFSGVQTLLQLMPPAAQGPSPVSAPVTVPAGTVLDHPRYAYRGAMLDVARHFFTVDQVKRYIDEIAHYKINYLHLHLSDDQGWRIAIDGRPRLTDHGGSTEVGGGQGGFYTQADYSAIVAYAAARYVTVIPEIDMPGHTNAALASYAELNCDGVAPKLYTGINVGFSTLCTSREATYAFIDEVIGQLAKLTPGPYIHIGGDESQSTAPEDYVAFVERVQKIVESHGKTVIGWHEIASADLLPSTVAQYWDPAGANADLSRAAAKGTKVIMSPASHAYLDQKYDDGTQLGLDWAGLNDVDHAYDWDPATYVIGVPASAVLGVEASLWTETLSSSDDIDFMAFPRLPAIAEIGWSPAETHDAKAFRERLAAQGPRWQVMGVGYYKSPQVAWPAGS